MQPPPVTADHDERQFIAAAGPPLLQVEARDRRPCDQVPRGRRVPHDEVIRGDTDAAARRLQTVTTDPAQNTSTAPVRLSTRGRPGW